MKSKKIIVVVIVIVIFFLFDRYTWMPDRVRENTWLHESGRGLGDPIAYKWDFTLNGSKIIFNNNKSKVDFPYVYRNRQSKFYLLGCYLGNLYILDKIRNEVIIYSEK